MTALNNFTLSQYCAMLETLSRSLDYWASRIYINRPEPEREVILVSNLDQSGPLEAELETIEKLKGLY